MELLKAVARQRPTARQGERGLGPLIASLLVDGLEPVLDRLTERLDGGVDRPEVLVIELHDVASTVHDLPPFRMVAEYSPG